MNRDLHPSLAGKRREDIIAEAAPLIQKLKQEAADPGSPTTEQDVQDVLHLNLTGLRRISKWYYDQDVVEETDPEEHKNTIPLWLKIAFIVAGIAIFLWVVSGHMRI
jgi:hypothetical protein